MAGRLTHQLTEKQCRTVLAASRAAWSAGAPFNRFVTLAWELGGIDARRCVCATGNFVKLAREWMNARGYFMPWAWVQETGTRYGAHCHLLLHVPPELEPLFRPMPRRWARKVLGGEYISGVLQCQRLLSAGTAGASPAAYEAELTGKVHYMLKCAPAALEDVLGMLGKGHRKWGQSCSVYGKRAGVWQGWRKALKPPSPIVP
jgi:hypothetical protein